MRKSLCLFVLTLLVMLVFPGSAGRSAPALSAKSAVLMEAATGQILMGKNQMLRLPPASTTKIMTVLLALEQGLLGRVVTVSKHASETDGSSIWLEQGEKRTLRELLYGAMLNSGNDACVAIGEAVAGSEALFVKAMNAKAKELGARFTHFANTNGLPDPTHLTCAYDLALIARAALANPTFAEIARTKVENIPWPGKEWDRRLINHNKLLWRYTGADGVKTGYTREAGHCLVASATRDGRTLIAVILDSRDMYGEAAALLDYGFDRFTLIAPKARVTRDVPVKGGQRRTAKIAPRKPLAYAVPKAAANKIRLVVECPKELKVPVKQGMSVGSASLHLEGKVVAHVPLIAAETVAPRNFLWALASIFMRMFG